ncbi:MAG TPA: hypothetical protein VGQ99_16845 [Tepidisphaeraceae bacterium]|jgi:hypothetical protein|nr:hypothetical protein [Tepidisphaeraceae bacterium]
MRAGFGLVAVMVTIAIMIWLWASMVSETAKYGVPAQREAQQLAGQDEHGRRAMSSIELAPEEQHGKLQYMLVDSINPQGAMAKWFHLQTNDQIIAAGPLNFRDMNYDAGMAEALIQQAYQFKQELTIMRGGKKIVLPEERVLDDGSSLSQGVAPTTAPTTRPAEAKGSPLKRQLDAISGGAK